MRGAEGAMQESGNILQRMRELSIQSANDTNSASDRTNIQKEVTALANELNRIADQTTFNGKNLLDGTFGSSSLQVGVFANEAISISLVAARATTMGAYTSSSNTNVGTAVTAVADYTAATNGVDATADLTVIGSLGSSGSLDVAAGDAASDIAALVNGASGSTGVNANASNSVTVSGLTQAGTVSFNLLSQNAAGTVGSSVAISAGVTTTDLTSIVTAINAQTATTGITATVGATNASMVLSNTTGDNIVIDDFQNDSVAASTIAVGAEAAMAEGEDVIVGGQVTLDSNSSFTVNQAATTTIFAEATNTAALSSVADIDVSTQAGATAALNVIDNALSLISSSRADLGAIQNRLSSTIANQQNVSENVSAARSRVMDADFAAETASLTKAQILQQAGTAMLAQANQLPQTVLSLLQ